MSNQKLNFLLIWIQKLLLKLARAVDLEEFPVVMLSAIMMNRLHHLHRLQLSSPRNSYFLLHLVSILKIKKMLSVLNYKNSVLNIQ
uniref:Putative secreted protein n=1 Tax=Panstrongylus lignarius TaxID=156445 RepID=A0A224XS77_9HEMI